MLTSILTEAFIVSLLVGTVRMATPLLFAALGELVTERSGILNLGVEGTMLMGAFIGFLTTSQTNSLFLGVLMAIFAGGVFGLLMAFLSYSLKANQIIAGLAINIIAAGISFFWYRVAFYARGGGDIPTVSIFPRLNFPMLSDLPYLGRIVFSHYSLTYLAFFMVLVVGFFLYKTKYGLELRCIGENPRAMDLKGINIGLYSYLAVVFGGMMAGLGGAFLTLGSAGLFVPEITAGRGWLAIVIVIAGNWRPGRILLVTLLFSLLDAFQMMIQGMGFQLPYQIFLAFPYFMAVVVLVLTRSRSESPAALGIPYNRE